MRQLLLAAVLTGLSVSVAFAQSAPAPTGNLAPPPKFFAKDLQALCDGPDGSARLAGCLRYMQGTVAMYELVAAESGKELAWFCAPREAPATILRQQFVEWARDNPDQMNLEAIQVVRQALVDAFPCQGD